MVTAEEARKQEEQRKQQEEARKKEAEARAKQTQQPASPPSNSPQRGRATVGGIKVSTSHEDRIKELEGELERERKRMENQINPDDLVGDLAHGELGWVELDEEGKPTGPATKEPPEIGTTAARVVGFNPHMDSLVTPSGAPVTEQMNPSPDFHDEGMLKRNPLPDVPLDLKAVPVKNTPVRV